MALAELGEQLKGALKRLQTAPIVDEQVLQSCLKDIASALLRADVNVRYVAQIRDHIKGEFLKHQQQNINHRKFIQKLVTNELVSLLSPNKKPYKPEKGKRNIVMFVGLQGSGKTTTCTKYAYFYVRKGWKVALICADTFRAGAFDQLKQNATKIGIPFYGSYTETDPVKIGVEGVERLKQEKFDIIIVDTSGRHMQEASLFDEMRQMETAIRPDHIVFVVDSHIGQACFDQATAFNQSVEIGSVIITKLDGHAKGGGALSAVAATNSPILFIGTGEHFDDFEQFDPESFISRLLGVGDIRKFLSTMAEVLPSEEDPIILESFTKKGWNYRVLKHCLQTFMKIGRFDQILSLMPGLESISNKIDYKAQLASFKSYLTMLDSMTNQELDRETTLTNSRIQRIAYGSGYTYKQVEFFIERAGQLSKLTENYRKLGMGKGMPSIPGFPGGSAAQDPTAFVQKLQNKIKPRLPKNMGGGGQPNIRNIMQQMLNPNKRNARNKGNNLFDNFDDFDNSNLF